MGHTRCSLDNKGDFLSCFVFQRLKSIQLGLILILPGYLYRVFPSRRYGCIFLHLHCGRYPFHLSLFSECKLLHISALGLHQWTPRQDFYQRSSCTKCRFPQNYSLFSGLFQQIKVWSFHNFLSLNCDFRLIQYGLDDAQDNVANYLILSLQSEQIKPRLEVIV